VGGPQAERFALGGVVGIVSPQRELPMVALRLLVPAGSWEDPQGKEGIAYLTAQLLPEGTKKKSPAEIHEFLDRSGSRFFVETNGDYTMVGFSVLRKDLAGALELMVEILREPAFLEEEFYRRKQRLLGEIASQEDRPAGLAHRAFLNALWGPSGYGHDPRGFKEAVDGFQISDVQNHYKNRIQGRRVLFVAVGDVEPEAFQEGLSQLLAGWPGIEITDNEQLSSRPQEGSRIFINKDLPQATVVMGQRSLPRAHQDVYALWVMNHILGGGGFASRLMEEIRSRRGLAYAVSSTLDARMKGGLFRVGFQTENRNVPQAVEIALQQAEVIRKEPVSPKELEEAKSFLVGSFPVRLDSLSSTAGSLALWELYGLGLNYQQEFTSRIEAVNQEEILRVAWEHLRPQEWTHVFVGQRDLMGTC
jgi:zinc protease